MTYNSPSSNKWDRIYSGKTTPGAPCSALKQNLHLLPENGLALDLASGLGANAILLAQQGLNVEAWDISKVGLQKLAEQAKRLDLQQTLKTKQIDVEENPPKALQYDIIVVSFFLHRPICEAIAKALKPGGLLFYQTYHYSKLTNAGPSSSHFLLQNNELLRLFPELNVLFYQELSNQGNISVGDRDTATLIAQRPSE